MRRWHLLTIGLLLLAPPMVEARWTRVVCGPVEVVTDASARTGRQLGERLVLASRMLGRNGAAMPVKAWGLASGQRFAAVRPGKTTRGFYQSAADRDYIVLEIDGSGSDWTRVAAHETVHLVLHHSMGPLPQWLEEGLAEFYSTVEVSEGRGRVGQPVREHLRLLASTGLLAGSDLAAISKDSPGYHEGERAGIFYAQSWAMVHMLRMGERYRARFGEFVDSVGRGEPQAAAFQRVYGQSFSEAVGGLRAYLDRGSLAVIDMPLPGATAGDDDVGCSEPVTVDEIEAELAYAEMALHAGHPEEAERVYRKVERKPVDSARAAASRGLIALARKQSGEAKRYFEQAMQYPDVEAFVPFEYAMLLREEGAASSREQVRRYLETAVAINPSLAEAHFLIGVAEANEERHAEAVTHLERAVRVFPRQSYFWHALALSYHSLGRGTDAKAAAQRALDAAVNAEQVEMARAALRLAETPATVAAPSGERRQDVITPDSWRRPEGDAKVEGVLEQIDCLGTSARFVVRSGGKLLRFFVEKPGEVLLKNLSSATFEFRCGLQKPVPVVVEYRAEASGEQMTIGVVTGLEFR